MKDDSNYCSFTRKIPRNLYCRLVQINLALILRISVQAFHFVGSWWPMHPFSIRVFDMIKEKLAEISIEVKKHSKYFPFLLFLFFIYFQMLKEKSGTLRINNDKTSFLINYLINNLSKNARKICSNECFYFLFSSIHHR